MSRSATYNNDLEQGRYGHFVIRAGTPTCVIPDRYVVGGIYVLTDGTFATLTYAGEGTATGLTGAANIPAGSYIPARWSEVVGDGVIEAICFFEPE